MQYLFVGLIFAVLSVVATFTGTPVEIWGFAIPTAIMCFGFHDVLKVLRDRKHG